MPRCELCGNESNRTYEIVMNEESHIFDSFECAIHALAPACVHCGCRILGHGYEAQGQLYCCEHCASHSTAHSG
jgi:hypothetical protein